ncbi:MAG: HEPN domain-containing protein, partial [Pseudomonadota bacterium]
GRLKPGRFSARQVQDRLRLAVRDLATARKLKHEDFDWAFSIAYNAMLQAGRALMFQMGFRPAAEGQHVTVIRFLELVMGQDGTPFLALMDRMRRKRNISTYDMVGTISVSEVSQAIENAEAFVSLIERQINLAR